jgi:hypothetical protein
MQGGSAGRPESALPPEVCEVAFAPGVSLEQRKFVLEHYDAYCRMCGTAPGDIDDLTGRSASFYVELSGGKNTPSKNGDSSNLRMLCSSCDEGARQITSVKPPAIWLLSQVRRAGQEEQRAVLDWLLKKFKE